MSSLIAATGPGAQDLDEDLTSASDPPLRLTQTVTDPDSKPRYLNNPRNILDFTVNPGLPPADLHHALCEVVRAIASVPPGPLYPWRDLRDNEVVVAQLTGGITNILFLLTADRKEQPVSTVDRVIVRIFGLGTDTIIDRNIENTVFANLSASANGSSSYPTFYGLFSNGRIEGYIPSRGIQPQEMQVPAIARGIAIAVVDLHGRAISSLPADPFIWDKLESYTSLALDVRFPGNVSKQAALDLINLTEMRDQYEIIKEDIQYRARNLSLIENANSAFHLGCALALSTALCHNDLLSGNILLRSQQPVSDVEAGNGAGAEAAAEAESCSLIDYEYAAYNYRGFDIANHFCEYAGFDGDFIRHYPLRESRFCFYRAYIGQFLSNAGNSEASAIGTLLHSKLSSAAANHGTDLPDLFLEGFDEVVLKLTSIAHIFWGMWAVVQSSISSIDFDYIGYAGTRFKGHTDHLNRIQELAAIRVTHQK